MEFAATRLAPSPTGALHLGHARTFLVTWWMARQAGAKVFMRMEDLDAGRAKAESVGQAYEELRWLGMDWDGWKMPEGENSEFGIQESELVEGAVVQSRRTGVYEAALAALWRRGAVFPCTCSRAEIVASVVAAGNAPHAEEGNVRYLGTCRGAAAALNAEGQSVGEVTRAVRERTGKNVCWRLRVREGDVAFEDVLAGRQAFAVGAEVGDFPVTRFAGVAGEQGIPAAYQLACVVDDHAMGIDLVVRGDDLLSSTPRQLLAYEALGWTPPRFAHVPLVVGTDGKRLAKRHGESRIAQFRAAGVSAERVVGWAAWRSGQLEKPGEISAAEMVARFDWKKMGRGRVVLETGDWAWLG